MGKPNNFSHVADNIYIVRTQAGLRQAIKRSFPDHVDYHVASVPKAYPSLIALVLDDEYGFIVCQAVHLNVLKAAIEKSEAEANFKPQSENP